MQNKICQPSKVLQKLADDCMDLESKKPEICGEIINQFQQAQAECIKFNYNLFKKEQVITQKETMRPTMANPK